jgi:hypothetical protein
MFIIVAAVEVLALLEMVLLDLAAVVVLTQAAAEITQRLAAQA